MKLRNMSATVERVNSIMLELASGERMNLEDAYILTSYSSRVAVYCKMRVYLLPRYDYSVTTWKHVHAFIQDYCSFINDYDYGRMLDFVRDNETIEDDNAKYLDVVEHIAKDIYEHTDINDYSDFSAVDVACTIMNEATIHYWYWEEPEY